MLIYFNNHAQSPIPVSLLILDSTDILLNKLAVECFLGLYYFVYLGLYVYMPLLLLMIVEYYYICSLYMHGWPLCDVQIIDIFFNCMDFC